MPVRSLAGHPPESCHVPFTFLLRDSATQALNYELQKRAIRRFRVRFAADRRTLALFDRAGPARRAHPNTADAFYTFNSRRVFLLTGEDGRGWSTGADLESAPECQQSDAGVFGTGEMEGSLRQGQGMLLLVTASTKSDRLASGENVLAVPYPTLPGK